MDVNKLRKINQLTATLRKHGLAACNDDATEIASRINCRESEETFSSFISHKEPALCSQNTEESKNQDYIASNDNYSENNGQGEINMEKQKGLTEEKVVKILQSFSDQFCEQINTLKSQIEKQNDIIKELSCNYGQRNDSSMQEENEDSIIIDELISEEGAAGKVSANDAIEPAAMHTAGSTVLMQQHLNNPAGRQAQPSAASYKNESSVNANTHQIQNTMQNSNPSQKTLQESGGTQTRASNNPMPRSGSFSSNDVAIEKFFYFGTK